MRALESASFVADGALGSVLSAEGRGVEEERTEDAGREEPLPTDPSSVSMRKCEGDVQR